MTLRTSGAALIAAYAFVGAMAAHAGPTVHLTHDLATGQLFPDFVGTLRDIYNSSSIPIGGAMSVAPGSQLEIVIDFLGHQALRLTDQNDLNNAFNPLSGYDEQIRLVRVSWGESNPAALGASGTSSTVAVELLGASGALALVSASAVGLGFCSLGSAAGDCVSSDSDDLTDGTLDFHGLRVVFTAGTQHLAPLPVSFISFGVDADILQIVLVSEPPVWTLLVLGAIAIGAMGWRQRREMSTA